MEMYPEEDEEEEDPDDEYLITNSPEPPEPVEPDDTVQMDENGQPGRLHPEQDVPHVFRVGYEHVHNLMSHHTQQNLKSLNLNSYWFPDYPEYPDRPHQGRAFQI